MQQTLSERKDRRDPNELRKSRQAHPTPKPRTIGFRPGNKEFCQSRPTFLLEASLDLPHQAISIATNAREDLACLLVFANENQITRRLRNYHRAYEKGDSRHSFHPEHPAPGRRPEPKDRASISTSKPN